MKNKIFNYLLIAFYIIVLWFGIVFLKTYHDEYKAGINKILNVADFNRFFSKADETEEMDSEMDEESEIDAPYAIVNASDSYEDDSREEDKSVLEKTFDNMFGVFKGKNKSTKNNKNSGKTNNSGSNNNNNNSGNNNTGTNNNTNTGNNNTGTNNNTNTGNNNTVTNNTNTGNNNTGTNNNSNSGKTNNTNTTSTKPSTAEKIHYISVGGSDAILIESNGKYGLVDSSHPKYKDGTPQAGGKNTKHTVEHVVKYLKKIMNCSEANCKGKLSFVIATHSHSDHIGGMTLIASNFVNSNTTYYYRKFVKTANDFVRNGYANSSHADGSYDRSKDWDNQGYYSRSLEAMKGNGAKLVDVTEKNINFKLGDFDIRLLNTSKVNVDESVCLKGSEYLSKVGELSSSECEKKGGKLYGRDENVNSILTLITYKQSKTLLAGDIESYDEARLIKDKTTKSLLSNIDVFKLGHHGVITSNRKYFLDVLKPKDAVMTSGGIGLETKNIIELKYANDTLKTKIYTTDSVSDAIVQTYDSKGKYTMKSYTSSETLKKIEFKEVKTNGNFHLLKVYGKEGLFYYDGVNAVGTTGWKKIDGNWYYINRNGYTFRGWKLLSYKGKEEWFYFNNSGKMLTGWIAYKGEEDTQKYWYYLANNGIMQTGWQKITYKGNEEWFYFKADGKMVTGWQNIKYKGKEQTFYFDSNGVMQTGWQKIELKKESHWFYFNSEGVMQKSGCQTIKSKKYCFDSNGICTSGDGC